MTTIIKMRANLNFQNFPWGLIAHDKRQEGLILSFLFALGVIFRLPHLTEYSLWLDETWRVALAEAPLKSLSEMPFGFFSQVIGYEGLLRLMTSLFGHSETAVRIISGLAGALAVPATYRLGRLAFDRNLAILAALLLCLSPLHITYSQEAAAYAIASLATLVFLINVAKLTKEIKASNFIYTAVSASIMGLAHIYLLFFVATVWSLYAFTSSDRRFVFATFAGAGVVIFLNIPNLLSMLSWGGSGQLHSWEISEWTKSYPIRIINSFVSGPLNERHCQLCLSDYYVPSVGMNLGFVTKIIAWVALVAAFFSPISALILAKKNKNIGIWLISSTLYIVFLILQPLLTNSAEVRYVVPILPVLFIMFASISVPLRNKWTKVFGAFVLVTLLINFLVVIKSDPPGKKWKPDIRSVAMRINEDCAKNKGIILINPEFVELPIYEFYLSQLSCKILRQPAFEEYFYQDRRSLLYRTSKQKQEENEWFGRYLQENVESISAVYIVSQREKARANQIADTAESVFKHVTKSEFDSILIIKLEK